MPPTPDHAREMLQEAGAILGGNSNEFVEDMFVRMGQPLPPASPSSGKSAVSQGQQTGSPPKMWERVLPFCFLGATLLLIAAMLLRPAVIVVSGAKSEETLEAKPNRAAPQDPVEANVSSRRPPQSAPKHAEGTAKDKANKETVISESGDALRQQHSSAAKTQWRPPKRLVKNTQFPKPSGRPQPVSPKDVPATKPEDIKVVPVKPAETELGPPRWHPLED